MSSRSRGTLEGEDIRGSHRTSSWRGKEGEKQTLHTLHVKDTVPGSTPGGWERGAREKMRQKNKPMLKHRGSKYTLRKKEEGAHRNLSLEPSPLSDRNLLTQDCSPYLLVTGSIMNRVIKSKYCKCRAYELGFLRSMPRGSMHIFHSSISLEQLMFK